MESIIQKSKTISEAIIGIYGYDNGKSRKKFFDLVNEKNIDITHLRKRKQLYERVVKKCPVCDTEFETIINHKHEKTTCSYACANTYFRSGRFNPNWKDDTYRTTCFHQHKKECVICGEAKIVAVHHFDENHTNNSIENLIPLCPTHHQYVHSRYKDDVMDTIIEYRNKFIEMTRGSVETQ
jgi:5-methylcytosine-specific restriction endonuclease McrA